MAHFSSVGFRGRRAYLLEFDDNLGHSGTGDKCVDGGYD